MSSMANPPKVRKVRSLHSLVQVRPTTGVIEAMEQVLSLVEKARSFHSCKTLATDVEEAGNQKTQDCKALDTVCRGCRKKRGTLRRSVSKLNIPHIHLRFHKLPPVLLGLVTLFTSMMMDNQYLPIWSVCYIQTNI